MTALLIHYIIISCIIKYINLIAESIPENGIFLGGWGESGGGGGSGQEL